MKKVSIKINSNINEIRSVFKTNVLEMDILDALIIKKFIPKRIKRFVGKFEGTTFQIRIIHFNSFLSSPILRGEIEPSGENESTIILENDLSILLLFYIAAVPMFLLLIGVSEFSNYGYPLLAILLGVGLIFILFQVHAIRSKKAEIKHFFFKIFREKLEIG